MLRHAPCICAAVLVLACDDAPVRRPDRPRVEEAPVSMRDGGTDASAIVPGTVVPSGSDGGASEGAGDAPATDDLPADDAGSREPAGERRPLAARVCPAGRSAGSPLPVQASATLVQDGFGFLEGPVWVESRGVLLFSDMDFGASGDQGPPARIVALRPPAQFDVVAEHANSNGLALDADGNVLACSHDLQDLAHFDPADGTRRSLQLRYMGQRFNSPNDLTVRSDGTIYFTDPDWQLGPRASETGITGVYRADPQGEVWLVDDQLERPNGIALSPDERTLYVGSAGDDVVAYPVAGDGSVGERDVFASPGASDGMAVDCAGNLYVTSGSAVHVFAPDGNPLGRIEVAGEPSNAAFGGAERRMLYITAGDALHAIELAIPGLPY
jgi:gluconolactonase